MRVCDASTSISAEFGGIRDSCLDIYHLINFYHKYYRAKPKKGTNSVIFVNIRSLITMI